MRMARDNVVVHLSFHFGRSSYSPMLENFRQHVLRLLFVCMDGSSGLISIAHTTWEFRTEHGGKCFERINYPVKTEHGGKCFDWSCFELDNCVLSHFKRSNDEELKSISTDITWNLTLIFDPSFSMSRINWSIAQGRWQRTNFTLGLQTCLIDLTKKIQLQLILPQMRESDTRTIESVTRKLNWVEWRLETFNVVSMTFIIGHREYKHNSISSVHYLHLNI